MEARRAVSRPSPASLQYCSAAEGGSPPTTPGSRMGPRLLPVMAASIGVITMLAYYSSSSALGAAGGEAPQQLVQSRRLAAGGLPSKASATSFMPSSELPRSGEEDTEAQRAAGDLPQKLEKRGGRGAVDPLCQDFLASTTVHGHYLEKRSSLTMPLSSCSFLCRT